MIYTRFNHIDKGEHRYKNDKKLLISFILKESTIVRKTCTLFLPTVYEKYLAMLA